MHTPDTREWPAVHAHSATEASPPRAVKVLGAGQGVHCTPEPSWYRFTGHASRFAPDAVAWKPAGATHSPGHLVPSLSKTIQKQQCTKTKFLV